MRKFGSYKPYHHELDIKPVQESVTYINETWIADAMIHAPHDDHNPDDLIPDQPDNIRVYIPLDLNKDSILRRLGGIIHTYGSVSESNETSYVIASCSGLFRKGKNVCKKSFEEFVESQHQLKEFLDSIDPDESKADVCVKINGETIYQEQCKVFERIETNYSQAVVI